MEKLNKLVELAKKATPGKWWIDSHGHRMVAFSDDDMEIVFVTKSESMGAAKRHEDTGNLSHWRNDNDATFIAAANPATILAIAEAFRALEQGQCGTALMEREEHHVEVVGELLKRNAELVRRAEAAEAEVGELNSGILSLIPDCRYMDPPDGGDVTPLEQLSRMVAEMSPAPAVSLAPVSNCLSFFASVIKSGESWSATCQRDLDAARETLRNIEEAK